MPTMTAADIEAYTALTGRHPHWIDVHDGCGVDCKQSPAYREEVKAAGRALAAEQREMNTAAGLVERYDSAIKHLGPKVPGAGGVEGSLLRAHRVRSSDGKGWYTVSERQDTVYGGTYWFCECQGWAPARGRGKDCRHVKVTRVEMEKR